MKEGSVAKPRYFKFVVTLILEKGPPEHATPIFGISCDEGWRQSIVCTGMYEYVADWLVEILQGKPFASENRP
jgi:hypothetical protein